MLNTKLDKLFNSNISLVLLFLLFHLTVVYTKAIYFLNPDKVFVWYDLPLSFIVALGYSFITIINIRQGISERNNIIFAVLDTIGVFLYYNGTQSESTYIILQSAFFAFLTGFGVYSIGHISLTNYKNAKVETNKDETIKTQSLEIAKLTEQLKEVSLKLETLQKKAQEDVVKLAVYKKGYYLYIKGRFNISKEQERLNIASEFEKLAEDIDIDIVEYTLKNN